MPGHSDACWNWLSLLFSPAFDIVSPLLLERFTKLPLHRLSTHRPLWPACVRSIAQGCPGPAVSSESPGGGEGDRRPEADGADVPAIATALVSEPPAEKHHAISTVEVKQQAEAGRGRQHCCGLTGGRRANRLPAKFGQVESHKQATLCAESPANAPNSFCLAHTGMQL